MTETQSYTEALKNELHAMTIGGPSREILALHRWRLFRIGRDCWQDARFITNQYSFAELVLLQRIAEPGRDPGQFVSNIDVHPLANRRVSICINHADGFLILEFHSRAETFSTESIEGDPTAAAIISASLQARYRSHRIAGAMNPEAALRSAVTNLAAGYTWYSVDIPGT